MVGYKLAALLNMDTFKEVIHEIPFDELHFQWISRSHSTSKMELFVSLVNSFQLFANVLKNSIFEVMWGPRYAGVYSSTN